MKKTLIGLLIATTAFAGFYPVGPGGGGGSGITSINGDTTAAQLISGSNNISASTSGGTTTVNGTLLAPKASPTFTGTIGTPLTVSRSMVTDGSGNLGVSSTTSTELGYVHGVTSAIQTQLGLLAPLASPTFTGTITTPLTANGVVISNGSNQLATVAPGTSGNVLTSNGTSWTSAAASGGGITGPGTTVVNSVTAWNSTTGAAVLDTGILLVKGGGTGVDTSFYLGNGTAPTNTGTDNTVINSQSASITGNHNTLVGKSAFITGAGSYNTAIDGDLYNTPSGAIAVGYESYASTNSVSVGYYANNSSGTGTESVNVGHSAGLNNGHNYTTNVGSSAGSSGGANSNAFGYLAGAYDTAAGSFYVDAFDRTNTAGGKAGAIIYGVMNATPASQTLTINAATTISSLSTAGVMVNSSAGLISSVAPGTSGNVLTSNGTAWTSAAATSGGTVTSVSVVSANGLAGTVANPTTTPALTLSTTITGILQGNGTAISAATTGNLTDAGTDGIVVTNGAGAVLGSGTSLAQHVADTTHNGYLSSADWNTFNGKGSGTVTSVALTTPGVLYSVSGSPVTTSGTFALALISQAQNSVLAGPTSGSGNPSFRALVSGDVPAAGSSGQLQYNNGGVFAGVANSSGSDASGYIFPLFASFSMPGPRVVQNDNTNWFIMPWTGKFTKAQVVAKTGPTGASLILDIQKSTNGGSSFATLWGSNPSNKPTIAAAANTGSTTSFDTTTFNAGDLLRVDIDQVGSTVAGSDITLQLSVATQNQ